MPDPDQAISIVIPNWNGKHLLSGCLDSIQKQQAVSARVIVVDNGSSDGSVAYLQQHYPDVELVALPENGGFSVAVNHGIRAATEDLIFLLNNDTELASDCLEQLTLFAANHPEFDFFAAKMLSFKQRDILDGAGDGMLRGGAGYKLGMLLPNGPPFDQAAQVFGACAGAALYRRSFFTRVGYFDEDFFAYLEDVDLNLRANRAGMRCLFIPDARVYHIGCASSGAVINPLTVRLSTRNSINLLIKNYSLLLWLRFLLPILLYQFFWLLVALRNKQIASWGQGVFQALVMAPAMLAKKRKVKQQARLSDRELGDLILASERMVVDSILHLKQPTGAKGTILRWYRRIFL